MEFTKEVTVNSRRSLYYARHDSVQYVTGTTVRAKEFSTDCTKIDGTGYRDKNSMRRCLLWPRRMQSGIYVHVEPLIDLYPDGDVETISVMADVKDLLGVSKAGAACFRKVLVM